MLPYLFIISSFVSFATGIDLMKLLFSDTDWADSGLSIKDISPARIKFLCFIILNITRSNYRIKTETDHECYILMLTIFSAGCLKKKVTIIVSMLTGQAIYIRRSPYLT